MPEVRLTAQARRDLLDLWLHIAADNPAAADRLYARLEKRIRLLETRPEAGRRRTEIAAEARSLLAPPYLILYRILPHSVQIVRVVHGRRRLGAALFEGGVV